MYNISIQPPILAILTMIFLSLVAILVSISIYDSVTKYKDSNTIRGRLEVVFGMVLESSFFLFLLLNIVLLYRNL
nr:MAG TPA: hypothetical protein [Bacteriophage sp.]